SKLVTHDGLHVVGESRRRHDVRDASGQLGVGISRFFVVTLRFVAGLYAKERGVIGALAMDQRSQTLVRQFFFTSVSDGDLGGAFQGSVAIIRTEGMRRKSLNQSAAFDAADGHAPTVLRKGVRHSRS